jgi:hypothetical protein
MADWGLPGITDSYITTILQSLKARDVDAATLAESPTTPPTGFVRYNRAANKFQEWSGSAWVDLVLSIAGGGTGATSDSAARTALGLGTMAVQNSNSISVTGGSISGLSSLSTSGNVAVGGVLSAGSGPTTLTNSTGQILDAAIPTNGISESKIADGSILARNASNEDITGAWKFSGNPRIENTAPILGFVETDGDTNEKVWRAIVNAEVFSIQVLSDDSSTINSAISITRSGATVAGITIAGATSFSSTVSVTGAVTLSSSLSVGTTLGVTGATTLSNTLGVTGATTLSSTLGVTGAVTLSSTLGVTGVATFSNTINVADRVVIAGNTPGLAITESDQGTNEKNWMWVAANKLLMLRAYDDAISGSTGIITITRGTGTAISSISIAGGTVLELNATTISTVGNLTVSGTSSITGVASFTSQIRAANGTSSAPGISFSGNPALGIYRDASVGLEFVELVGGSGITNGWSLFLPNGDSATIRKNGIPIFEFHTGDFAPITDNACSLGISTNRWTTVYATNGTINTSDIRHKNVHGEIDPGEALDIVCNLETFVASWKNDRDAHRFPAFSAQDVLAKVDNHFGTEIVKVDRLDCYGMNQEKMLPVIVAAIKKLREEIRDVRRR